MTNVAFITHGVLRGDRLFDVGASRDNCLERFSLLREALAAKEITCRTADMFEPGAIDFLIFHDMQNELATVLRVVKANPNVKLIYIASEPAFLAPLHDESVLPYLPVDTVLTWNDRVAGNYPLAIKCNIGQPVIREAEMPAVPLSDRRFICCIYSNKYSAAPGTLYRERLDALDFFSRKPCGIDLYGVGWEESTVPSVVSSFKGRCREKKEVLKRYKFSLAYENVVDVPGLITEKIFDCFAARTVPVYYGAPNIHHYVPQSCFVDFRDFRGYGDLYDFLSGMPESQYLGYQSAIREYLTTPQYQLFCSGGYVEVVTGQILSLGAESGVGKRAIRIKAQLLKLLAENPQLLKRGRLLRRLFWDLASVW